MGKIVFGVAATEFQAEAVVNELRVADFCEDEVSVVLADKVAPAARTAGVPPGLSGGTLGWLSGISAVSIPGAGPFIAAGPIIAALAASAVGRSSHGIADALEGMGLTEASASRLEKKIRGGAILVAVHAGADLEASRARAILEQAEAQEIVSSIESSFSPSPSNEDLGFGERRNAAS